LRSHQHGDNWLKIDSDATISSILPSSISSDSSKDFEYVLNVSLHFKLFVASRKPSNLPLESFFEILKQIPISIDPPTLIPFNKFKVSILVYKALAHHLEPDWSCGSSCFSKCFLLGNALKYFFLFFKIHFWHQYNKTIWKH